MAVSGSKGSRDGRLGEIFTPRWRCTGGHGSALYACDPLLKTLNNGSASESLAAQAIIKRGSALGVT